MHTHHHHDASRPGAMPFPADRCRPPAAAHSPLRDERLALAVIAACQAERFRALDPAAAEAAIAADLRAGGADAIASALEANTAAIAAFGAILATLLEADRRMAAAADRALTAAGLPSSSSEVR